MTQNQFHIVVQLQLTLMQEGCIIRLLAELLHG